MPTHADDALLRAAAFEQVRRLQVTRDQLTSQDLSVGFFSNGTRYPLINPQRGILPMRAIDHPDRDRLGQRFKIFRATD